MFCLHSTITPIRKERFLRFLKTCGHHAKRQAFPIDVGKACPYGLPKFILSAGHKNRKDVQI
jgi:hypothetical protein